MKLDLPDPAEFVMEMMIGDDRGPSIDLTASEKEELRAIHLRRMRAFEGRGDHRYAEMHRRMLQALDD